ncbi:MAG: hypothetical protein R3F39_19215 [Myxococcota bacterium]
MSPRLKAIVLAVAGLSLTTCAGDSGGTSAENQEVVGLKGATITTISGRVELPPGVEAASVVNALGSAQVTAGAFEIAAYSEGRQLAVALSASGDPLLMGWLGADHDTLSARSTIDVAAFWAAGGPTVPPELAGRFRELLEESSRLEPAADALTAALAASPQGLTKPASEVAAALTAALFELLPRQAVLPTALLVNPATDLSGIRLDQLSGFNEITIVNTFRRRAHVFVDRVSIIDETGEHASPEFITDRPIRSVKGLEGGLGTIGQILNATQAPGGFSQSEDVAYVPISEGPIRLSNVPGAKRTRYRVAVVGPGASVGDYSTLSEVEVSQQQQTSLEFLVAEVLLPSVLNVLIPSSKIHEYLDLKNPLAQSMVTDIANRLVVNAPVLLTRIKDFDLQGAIGEIYTLLGSSGVVREFVLELIIESTYDFRSDPSGKGFSRATAMADAFNKFNGILTGVDIATTVIDQGLVLRDIASSNAADVWTVDVADATVRLDPKESTVEVDDLVTLTAKVVDGGEDSVFEYRFTTAGKAGTIQSALHSGTDVTSSDPFITYVARNPGTETIKVDVHEIRLNARPYVGSATVTVTVEGTGVFVTPEILTVSAFGKAALSATVFGTGIPETLTFRWESVGEHGGLGGAPTVEATLKGQVTHGVTFHATHVPGDQDIRLVVVTPDGSGGEKVVGEATAEVKVTLPKVSVSPAGSELSAGESQVLTAIVTPAPTAGTLDFTWEVTTAEGLVDGKTKVVHAGLTKPTDAVTYVAAAEPSADCEQKVQVSTALTVAERTVQLAPTTATLRVDCPVEVKLVANPLPAEAGKTSTLTVTILPEPPATGTLSYLWSLNAAPSITAKGELRDLAGMPLGETPIASHQAVYHAPDVASEVSVNVEVHHLVDGKDKVLGAAYRYLPTVVPDVTVPGWVEVPVALVEPNEGCGDLTGFHNYHLWFFTCPDLETPWLRVEADFPAWSLPGWTHPVSGKVFEGSDHPAVTFYGFGPPFQEETPAFATTWGAPAEEGTHWVAVGSFGIGCFAPNVVASNLERLKATEVRCIGTTKKPIK